MCLILVGLSEQNDVQTKAEKDDIIDVSLIQGNKLIKKDQNNYI